jgi:hypothetical protein
LLLMTWRSLLAKGTGLKVLLTLFEGIRSDIY